MTTETVKIELLVVEMNKRVATMNDEMKEWTVKFLEDPEYQFKWADSLSYEIAERTNLLTMIAYCESYGKKMETSRISYEQIKEWADKFLDNALNNLCGSTSQMSNVMDLARIKACREWKNNTGWSALAKCFSYADLREREMNATYVLRLKKETTRMVRNKKVTDVTFDYCGNDDYWSQDMNVAKKFNYAEKEEMKTKLAEGESFVPTEPLFPKANA